MGCSICKKLKWESSIKNFSQLYNENKIEFADKRSQISRLEKIISTIQLKIKKIQEKVI
jgi:hypothetical protein